MSATPLPHSLLVTTADPGLYAHLQRLASEQRCVFFAGLPGTGKSLLSHQLTHLAHALGRTVHMLQWDVARPVFETSTAGQRYPVVHGMTHGVIRKAAGLWARQAVAQWHQRYPEAGHLLIGETPFVGHRFIELARRHADAALLPAIGNRLENAFGVEIASGQIDTALAVCPVTMRTLLFQKEIVSR